MFPILLVLSLYGAAAPTQTDYVIRNAMIYDGSGKPGYRGDLAIKSETIVGIGKVEASPQARLIDGSTLCVAPGFIDLHTHSDIPITAQATQANLCYIKQGVTTIVTGNCGSGPTNVAEFFHKLETQGIGSNLIHQVPHNDVRRKVMGNVNRPPTGQELREMEHLVDVAMRDGAWGLSTGLIYNPGTYSKTDELIVLAKVAAKRKGFYASHIRDEGTGLLDAVAEAIRIGKEAGLPVHISHIKASGKPAWGKSADAIALIEKARAEGQKVTADQYPYIASSTSLAATVIPARFREGTAQDFQNRLLDETQGPVVRKAIDSAIELRQGGRTIQIARYTKQPSWQGKTLFVVARESKQDLLDLVLEIERNGGAQIVNFGMNEEDVRLYMKQPWVATASDGSSQAPGNTVPHPRSYGCFARKIGRYAIQDRVIPMEQAIRSASGLPADVLELPKRGYLKVGYHADVVVFDPKTYRDQATFEKPHQLATGVRFLFINGQLVIDKGEYNRKLAGKVLRHE